MVFIVCREGETRVELDHVMVVMVFWLWGAGPRAWGQVNQCLCRVSNALLAPISSFLSLNSAHRRYSAQQSRVCILKQYQYVQTCVLTRRRLNTP